MAPGPAPTPTALKILRGNPGRKPLNHEEPQPEAGPPTCPVILKGEAKLEWKRLVEQLGYMNCLSKADRMGLTILCQAWADYVQACKDLEEHGSYWVPVGNQMHPHPAKRVRDDAVQNILKFSQEFGLTPAARSRIKVSKKPKAATDVSVRKRG